MAERGTKRKTVGHGPGSRSRNLKFNPNMFRSLGCEKFHESIPEDAKFIEEKAIIITPEDFDEMSQNIRNRGWEEYVCHPRKASRELVFEFFSNIFPRPGDEASKPPLKFPVSTSFVRGHEVPFDAATINRIFGLASGDTPDCLLRNKYTKKKVKEDPARAAEIRATLCIPGKDWERNSSGEPQNIRVKDLTPAAKGWANFISYTMFPSSNHSELSFDKANLATCIMRGEPINIGWLIEKEIKEYAEFKKGVPKYWKYASLVSLLCEDVGVVAGEDEETVDPTIPITSGRICARAGIEQPVQMEEFQYEQPGENEPTIGFDDILEGPSKDDFKNLQARMDAMVLNQQQMCASQEEMKQMLWQVLRNQDEMRQRLEQLTGNQGETSQPPPQ